jgi:competence protein ComEA
MRAFRKPATCAIRVAGLFLIDTVSLTLSSHRRSGMRKFRSCISCVTLIVVILACFAVSGAEDLPKIDINTASADELLQLKGIGEKKAAMIIEFREKQGPFESPEDLMKVPGIGMKTFEANIERIEVK